MDLMPLMHLRERLKAGAIAGTALLTDDFRLTRALEALSPLESASPVLARIGQGVRAMLDPGCPDPAAELLDVLALCDAVLVTQGTTVVEGELEPLPLTGRGDVLSNAPYSVLRPLLDALTGTGGGRYAFIVDTHETQPALFRDYRVKQALVCALGASYAELADKAEEWLCEEGVEIAPLLKEDFDPKGKREMVRRLHVLETVSGADENAFYLSLLETGNKEIRAEAAYALRLEEGNAETLLTLVKTEKGAVKKQAQWALAQMDSPAVWEYWNTLAASKPEQAAEFMAFSTARRAGEITANVIGRLLEPFETDPKAVLTAETAESLVSWLPALIGKSGEEVCRVFHRAAALGGALDRPAAGGKSPVEFRSLPHEDAALFSEAIPQLLVCSLRLRPTPDLIDLAAALDRECGGLYRAPHILAALLTRPACDAYALAGEWLKPGGLFKKKEPKQRRQLLFMAVGSVSWNAAEYRQETRLVMTDPVSQRRVAVAHPLFEPLDLRWYSALIALGREYEPLLVSNIRPGDEALYRVLVPYFLARNKAAPDSFEYVDALRLLRYPSCEDMAVRFCQEQKRLYFWNLRSFFDRLPGTAAEKAAEAMRVLKRIEEGGIRLAGPNDSDSLRALAEEYRQAAAV